MHPPRVTHVFGARVCRVPIVNIDPQILSGGVLGNFRMSEIFAPNEPVHRIRYTTFGTRGFRAPIVGERLFRASYTRKL